MPGWPARILIIAAWLVSSAWLVIRDVLPEYLVGEPPDWKRVVAATTEKPSRWLISVEDAPGQLRVVGQAVSQSRPNADGSTVLESRVRLDAQGLLKRTPLAVAESTEFTFASSTHISPRGLLDLARADVHVRELGDEPVLNVQAIPATGGKLEIRFSSRLSPLLNFRQTIVQDPRALVRGGLEPLDRLPGLRVGQSWSMQVLQPLTARPETIRSEVTAIERLFWNGNPVEAFVVMNKSSTFSARTWVRRDGLVLRQELPTPLVRLLLEREPEEPVR